MTYQSRKRNYKSRRERLAEQFRFYRITFIFAMIALAVWVIKERHGLWAWLKTYFY
ncbi:MAG: hypothetical protein AAF798_12300 [Bacteroidota bacterium]